METHLWDILVVDADEGFRNTLAQILRQAGYAVREASSGSQGLAELNREMPSLIMLVLDMPELNGFDLLKVLRDRPLSEQIPIVVIAKFGFAWEAALVEADGCIQKPLHPEEALRVIDFLLNKKKKQFLH